MTSAHSAPARELLRLGRSMHERGHVEEARALFTAARVTAETLDDRRAEAEACSDLGRLLVLACEHSSAAGVFETAHARFVELDDPAQALVTKMRIAFTAYDAGDVEHAASLLADVHERVGRAGADAQPYLTGLLEGYRSNVARSVGRLELAAAGYERAAALLGAAGDCRYAATFRMDAAVVALLEGRPSTALSGLASARRMAQDGLGDPLLDALLEHYTVLAASALGDSALARRGAERFERPVSRSLSFLAHTHQLAISSRPGRVSSRDAAALDADCPPFEHGRLTIQILRRSLGLRAPATRRLVLVDSDRAVRLDDRDEISLATRAPLFRLVSALVDAHERARGVAVTGAELVRASWPGERMDARSAKNRLHVAIATLRRLGLRDAIQRSGGGYVIAPALHVLRAP